MSTAFTVVLTVGTVGVAAAAGSYLARLLERVDDESWTTFVDSLVQELALDWDLEVSDLQLLPQMVRYLDKLASTMQAHFRGVERSAPEAGRQHIIVSPGAGLKRLLRFLPRGLRNAASEVVAEEQAEWVDAHIDDDTTLARFIRVRMPVRVLGVVLASPIAWMLDGGGRFLDRLMRGGKV
jgi:hypothetical protein